MIGAPLPQGPFACILADPPWGFLTYGRHRTTPHRTCVDHYATMTADELKALPVAGVASKDCALLMWAVDSHLEEAMHLGRAWGFAFKTRAFTWRKTTNDGSRARISMGYWTRKQTELCLLFTRGKPRRLSRGVREIIDAPRREHSRKPDEQYDRIEKLVAGPYLELFARTARPGWTAWGAETDRFVEPAEEIARRLAAPLRDLPGSARPEAPLFDSLFDLDHGAAA